MHSYVHNTVSTYVSCFTYTHSIIHMHAFYMNAEMLGNVYTRIYVQMHIHVCRLGNISLHGHTHTVLHVWFSQVTHISHWRTEVHSTIRILVLVHTHHFRCVELVEDADQRTMVPVVSHTTSIVTLTGQILQSCKLYFLYAVHIMYIHSTRTHTFEQ